MKTNSHNVGEPPEKQQFKKSYVRRITEEKEANQEIEQCIIYDREDMYAEIKASRNPNSH
jgi:hypothetical protein